MRSAVIRNAGKDAAEIAKAFSFCTELPDTRGTYSALRLAGSWARERTPVITPLAEGTLRIESARGYSSHQMNPILAVLAEDCGEESGECYGFNLLYSGSFAITADVSQNKSIRVRLAGAISAPAGRRFWAENCCLISTQIPYISRTQACGCAPRFRGLPHYPQPLRSSLLRRCGGLKTPLSRFYHMGGVHPD